MTQPDREQSERPEEPVEYGIKLSDLNDERLGKILEIFDGIFKGGAQRYLDGLGLPPTFLIQDFLRSLGNVELAFSSRFSPRTKLFITRAGYTHDRVTVVRFASNPNADPRNEFEEEEMNRAERDFKKLVSDYLEASGVGIRLLY